MQIKFLTMVGVLCVTTPAMAAVTMTEVGYFDGECVAYARSQAPGLPGGLMTIRDKMKIINSSVCRPGSVAIIDLVNDRNYAAIGHVAYVESCSRDGITIREANWRRGKITRRIATGGIIQAQKDLQIMGYWERRS